MKERQPWDILNMYRQDPRSQWSCEPADYTYDGIREAGRDGWKLIEVVNEAPEGSMIPFINFYFIRPLEEPIETLEGTAETRAEPEPEPAQAEAEEEDTEYARIIAAQTLLTPGHF